MTNRLTQDITRSCDRLTEDCDRLLTSAEVADARIDRLRLSAQVRTIQIGLLGHAQATLERQRRALSWRLFWYELHPSALVSRLRSAMGFKRRRSSPLAEQSDLMRASSTPG